MALWLNRTGRHGEHESKFLGDGRIYLTWEGVLRDLGKLTERTDLMKLLEELHPERSRAHRIQNCGQIWAFVHKMKPGDWVAVPSKRKTIHVGEITGDYAFDPKAPDPYHHFRTVKWLETDIPRTNFDQDILNSLGAVTTICAIQRNDAEARVRAMKAIGWRSAGVKPRLATAAAADTTDTDDTATDDFDIELSARDHIARLIQSKYSSHALEDLVEAILIAQGFTTHHSEKGPDGGVDILAAPSTLETGGPRICVQVKSQAAPLERPVLDQLLGTMSHVGAERGLLVCWGGFKKTIHQAMPQHFFKVRLWDQSELINQFLDVYDKLDEDMRAEIPLKQIWAVAAQDVDIVE